MFICFTPQVFITDGRFEVGLTIFGAAPGADVEFIYSFEGQGNGPDFGNTLCLNLKHHKSFGTKVATSGGRANISGKGVVPDGATHITFQVGVSNNGRGTQKSNVVTVQLNDPRP